MSCQAGRALRLPQGLVEADDHARARGGAAADGVHGGGEGEGAVVGGEEVGEREGGHLAEERGAARAGGEVDVVAGAVAVRPVLGVADQAEDAEPRVHGVQGLAVEPELRLGARAEGFDEAVGLLHQLVEGGNVLRVRQVEKCDFFRSGLSTTSRWTSLHLDGRDFRL